MVGAVEAFRDKKMGLLKASKVFSVPRATMRKIGIVLATTVYVVWTFILRG
jgi:hypothetical protein